MGISIPGSADKAPDDAAYVVGSSNSELTNETTVSPAGDILTSASFGTTTSISLSFGSFTQVDANNPSFAIVELFCQTDGSSNASINVEIDENGDGTRTYKQQAAFSSGNHASSTGIVSVALYYIPAGGQIKVVNANDPQGTNGIRTTRALILSP